MKNILLVDDDVNLRKAVRLVLKAEGYEVQEASGVATAWKKIKLKKTRPNFVRYLNVWHTLSWGVCL